MEPILCTQRCYFPKLVLAHFWRFAFHDWLRLQWNKVPNRVQILRSKSEIIAWLYFCSNSKRGYVVRAFYTITWHKSCGRRQTNGGRGWPDRATSQDVPHKGDLNLNHSETAATAMTSCFCYKWNRIFVLRHRCTKVLLYLDWLTFNAIRTTITTTTAAVTGSTTGHPTPQHGNTMSYSSAPAATCMYLGSVWNQR